MCNLHWCYVTLELHSVLSILNNLLRALFVLAYEKGEFFRIENFPADKMKREERPLLAGKSKTRL